MMRKLQIIAVMMLLRVIPIMAQDPQFTQFYAAPLYLNPAFAGAIDHSRAIFNGRVQWAGLSKPFVTYAASVDHNMEKYKSGIGLIAMLDKAGTGALTNSTIGAIYAYKIKISSKWVVRPAVQFAYSSRSINFYDLTFRDQLDLQAGSPLTTSETFDKDNRVSYFDFSAGALAHSETFWIGLVTHHLNTPDESLNEGGSIVPIKTTLHGGMKIDLASSVYRSHGKSREHSLTPTFLYKMQGKYDQLDFGLYYHHEPLVIGVWYRGIPLLKKYEPGYGNNDAMAILLGLKQDDFTIGYSYDLTVSRLGATRTAGSHEISLSYTFPNNKNINHKKRMRKKDMVIPCPKF